MSNRDVKWLRRRCDSDHLERRQPLSGLTKEHLDGVKVFSYRRYIVTKKRGGTNPGRPIHANTVPGYRGLERNHETEIGFAAPSRPDPLEEAPEPLSRRLSPTLARVCKRRRQAIGLSLSQLAAVTGIAEVLIADFEESEGASGISYDHAIVLRRALGIPVAEMPGLRPRDALPDGDAQLVQLVQSLLAGPLILFKGRDEEHLSGDLERAVTAPLFAMRIDDDSIGTSLRKGTLLAFRPGTETAKGDLVLIRHRREPRYALRHFSPPNFIGLAEWQPVHPVDEKWRILARAIAFLLPR